MSGVAVRAVAAAAAATLPLLLGVACARIELGFTGAFGAYLVVISHPDLPTHGRAPRLGATVGLFAAAGTIGAAAGMRPWVFIPLAIAGAIGQAWTEIADNGLRFPVAMSVLAMLLAAGNVSPTVPASAYAAAFAGGAVWQAFVQAIVAPRGAADEQGVAADLAGLRAGAAAARPFAAVMAALGLVGGTVAAFLPVPHAAWLLTAALRVMKPSRDLTLTRLRHRFIGTACGAILAGALLAGQLPALVHAAVLWGALSIMQLIGARRYALWTLCLTVVALDLGMLPQASGWVLPANRLMLTIGGLALAIPFSLRLP